LRTSIQQSLGKLASYSRCVAVEFFFRHPSTGSIDEMFARLFIAHPYDYFTPTGPFAFIDGDVEAFGIKSELQ
jgi:hypothetical protein